MNKLSQTNSNLIVFCCFLVGSLLIMFRHYEPTGETWGYWVFAKELLEGGGFVIPSRSPLYTLYLAPFATLPYPFSVTVEWIVTTLITCYCLYHFLRLKLSSGMAIFAILVWLPFIRFSEPPVQSLALALSCLAFALRLTPDSGSPLRRNYVISYAILIGAYFLRESYFLMILAFLIWDGIALMTNRSVTNATVAPSRIEMAVLIGIIAAISLFNLQSSHPWNNAYFATPTWFPGPPDVSLHDAGVIQHANWKYIQNEYGSFEKHDFYHTNMELFDGEATTLGALKTNPRFLTLSWLSNINLLAKYNAEFSIAGRVFSRNLGTAGSYIFGFLLIMSGIFLFRCRPQLILFLIASVGLVSASILLLPKPRYFVPIVPFLILTASYLANRFETNVALNVHSGRLQYLKTTFLITVACGLFLIAWYFTDRHGGTIRIYKYSLDLLFVILMCVAVFFFSISITQLKKSQIADCIRHASAYLTKKSCLPIFIILFANPFDFNRSWYGILSDLSNSPPRLQQTDNMSLRASFQKLKEISLQCTGLMALEAKFFQAYLNTEHLMVYDIWEIPPFGNYFSSSYNGLHSSRINCIFISNALADSTASMGTNDLIRYKNYIKPYVKTILNSGGRKIVVPGFGFAVISAL